MRRSKFFFALFFIIAGLLTLEVRGNQDELLGFWFSSIGDDDQKVVMHIYKNQNMITGESHSYSGKAKFNSLPFGRVNVDFPKIAFVSNVEADIRYKGELQKTKNGNIITGSLIYKDGSEMELNLKKLSSAELRKDFPGLADSDPLEYNTPPELNDGLETADIKESGLDFDKIDLFFNKIAAGEMGKIHSLLVYKNGKLLLEKYYDGFHRDNLHAVRSVTKSVGSLLVGIALDKNYLNNCAGKISSFFPEYKSEMDPAWNSISLRHILTMSAGLNWEKGEDEKALYTSDNVILATLKKKGKPIDKFEYRNPNVNLISGIIKKTTGEQADLFADRNLFKPLGIKDFDWDYRKQNGYPMIDGSLLLKPRDMLKFGVLILQNGKWNDEQIVSEKWIEKSTSPIIKVDENFDYGYLWWIGKSAANGAKVIMANGWGSQFILIVPSIETVIVTTGANFDAASHLKSLKMLDEYIISEVAR